MLNKFTMIGAFLLILTCGEFSQVFSQKNQCGDTERFRDLDCKITTLNLIDVKNPIKIKIYTNDSLNLQRDRTFVVVHNNEEKGLNAVKEVFLENGYGGRLVAVESNYKSSFTNFKEPSNERRYLYFGDGKYCVDPNRIYTEIGRFKALSSVGKRRDNGKNPPICEGTPNDSATLKKLKEFADGLLEIIKHNENNTEQYSFIIGVHNNTENGGLDVDYWRGKGEEAKTGLATFTLNNHSDGKTLHADDFVLVSNANLFYKLFDTRKPFNIAIQENNNYLIEQAGVNKGKIKENLDDGSMSIYFGTTALGTSAKIFDYINIEAAGKNDDNAESKKWQKTIIKKVIEMKLR